jgi:hypothetical protein
VQRRTGAARGVEPGELHGAICDPFSPSPHSQKSLPRERGPATQNLP